MTAPAIYRIYGFAACSWCVKAKELLAHTGIAFEAVDIPTQDERRAWMDERGFEGRTRTFPKIYALESGAERLIGGYRDLEADVFFDDCA